MNCPNCGTKLKASVVGTEAYRTFIARQRRCHQCGALIDTEEVITATRNPSARVAQALLCHDQGKKLQTEVTSG